MLQAWMSYGYIVLLAIGVLAYVLWRRGGAVLAIAALVVGIPLWFAWEYARPTWTTGLVTGTEVRRSNPDARGNTSDIRYVYMRNRSDRGLELMNEDSWWWLKRNSERVFNDAKTAETRNSEMTVVWNRWRSTLFSFYPNVIAIGPAGSWPLWSVRSSPSMASPLPCGWATSTVSSGYSGGVPPGMLLTPISGRRRDLDRRFDQRATSTSCVAVPVSTSLDPLHAFAAQDQNTILRHGQFGNRCCLDAVEVAA